MSYQENTTAYSYPGIFMPSFMLTMDFIEKLVLEMYWQEIGNRDVVTSESIRNGTRKTTTTLVRHLCMAMMKQYLERTGEVAIGEHFGGYNHSTVNFAHRKVFDQMTFWKGTPWPTLIKKIEFKIKSLKEKKYAINA